jgi:hypothetical protein
MKIAADQVREGPHQVPGGVVDRTAQRQRQS